MAGIVLVLDAMGVIYQSADDVNELLVPFIAQRGGLQDARRIEALYTRASLGELSADQFWHAVGISPNLEDQFLALHRLNPGVEEFLRSVVAPVDSLWCLSNDVSRWSRKLREANELVDRFAGFLISSDVGFRKPDEAIYRALLKQVGRPAGDCIFVDDRVKNLRAAKALGFRTVHFGAQSASPDADYAVRSFAELASCL